MCTILLYSSRSLVAQTYFVDQDNIVYGMEFDAPTDITITDDDTEVINIGFNFNFFGTTYTTCHLAENGFIQFGSNPAGGCCAGQELPSATAPNNLIAAAWMNGAPINCCSGGNDYVVFQYETMGTAPNRRLVITMSMDEDCGAYYSGQIKLFEGTDIIEIHTELWADNSEPCSNTTQGIENANGTEAFYLAGRNANTSWFVSCCDAVRFIPAYSLSQNDAGIGHIFNNPFCPGTHTIEALVTNYGALPLDSVVVDWTWEGVSQTSIMLEFNPPIPSGISILTELGEETFVFGEQYDIAAWTSFPNGVPDDEPQNDQADAILKTGVMDTFTIGGASPDFVTFASAISFLSATGVCDTVWMLVRPGTYTEQLTIPFISGATSSRVIFAAENGDSSSVILQFDPTVTNRHVLKFNNAAGITWERMTINALGTDYGRVIEFSVHSFDNLIQHCAINGINSSSTSLDLSCVYSSGTNNDNVFQFNTIKHGAVGIYHSYTSNIEGFDIYHNRIENFSSAGIRFTNAGALRILQNTIISTKNNVTGVDISGANDSLQISSNSLVLSSGQQGINLTSIAPPGNVQAGVSNNMVYVSHASGIAYGIKATSLSQTDVYHNTIKVSGPNNQNAALRIDVATQDSIFNNMLTSTGGGYSFYIGSAVSSEMDYNGYHHTGGIMGKYADGTLDVETLDDWQILTGYDSHSIFYPPHFAGESDLHLGNSFYNGVANPAWASELDIDGDMRNSSNPDIGADEFDPELLDASIAGLVSPGVSCDTFQHVEVILVNLGLDTLTEAIIHWSLNGDVQDPVPFTGEILPEGDTVHVTLQTSMMFDDVMDTLVFWADDLNGAEDMFIVNDTLSTTYSLPLNGNYTIGGSSPDFTTIAQAIDALELFSVCGPVVFSIRNGTYTEQVSIRDIAGTSAINTITFTSEALDSAAVTIQYDATTNANYIIQLHNAHHLHFEHLGFKTLNTTYANIFHVKGTSSHISLAHCYLEGRNPTIASGNSYLFYTDDTFQGHISINNSYFLNGTRAMYFLGDLTTPALRPDSFFIEDNQFVNQRTGAILFQYVKDVLIQKNVVSSNTTATYNGIQVTNSHGNNTVSHNQVNLTQTGDGITLNGVNSESTLYGECRVFNNMSSVVSGSAFALLSNRRLRFHFNTGYSTGSTAASHHAIRLSGGDSITVRNNIGVANAGRAYSESFFIPVVDVDYNNFYTSGTQLALRANISYPTLASWQTGTGLDSNSISVDPDFISLSDLHVLNSELNGAAQPVSWITTDIDGQLRDPIHPDIGADEIGTELNDAGIFALLPEMPFARGTQEVKAIVRNYGSNTLTSATISWQVNGNPQPDYYYIGELASLEHDTVILGQITFQLNTAYNITGWTYNPNQTNDSQTSNDTLVNSTLYSAVSGTVIVGATGELPTISNAVSAMYLGGIVDGVQFEIQPGTYQTSISLPAASFLHCGATVVFTSSTGNAADVIWDNTGMGTHALQFDGADGITFRHLTIKTTINAIQAIRFQNGSTCNLIEHCVIQGVTTTNTSSTYAPVLGVSTSSANYNPNNTLQYNTISNGSYGVYWDGFTGTTGLNISHNLLQNARVYGIWMHRLKAPTVHDNTVTSNSTIAVFKGLYFESCTENTTITANKILLHGKRSNGIELLNNNGTSTLPTRIANNYIILGSGATSYGLYTNNCTYINVYHNTIRISGGDNTGINIRRNLGGNVHYLNNILDNQANGKTMQIEGTATPFTSNYNAHYTEGTNLITYLGTNYTTLASWQATGRDLNSILEEPVYDAAAPLHYVITNSAMNGTASASSGITTDIESMPRDPVTPDMGCDEYDLFTHDVGLVSISYPHQPYPAGSNTVYVKFINNGADTLTSMQLNWEVNGVSQPVYYWTGLLPSAGTYDSLDIGEYDFIPNFYHEIKAWVSLPNAMPDELSANDTLTVDSLYPGLHGIYTIGGIDPDFETLSGAVTELNRGGASSNVTFNIRTGTYLDTLLINDFPGSDCGRSVTFQSESGNAADVLITNLGLDQHTIRLDGADGVIFQNVHIESVNPAFRHAISYFNGAHCNQFLNNHITGYQSTSTSTTASVIHSAAGLDTQAVFSGNLIQYGSYGIYIYGASTAYSGTSIDNNTFHHQHYRGIYAREEQQISITSNTITAASGNHIGIYLHLCHNAESISGNTIQIPFGNYGMYIDDCDALVSAPGLISNNFISIGGSGIARGIFINLSNYQRILHNNIHVYSTHGTPSNTSGVYATSCPSLSLMNNVLFNGGAGYAIFSNNNTSFSSDYNNLLTTGIYTGYWNGTSSIDLEAWRTISGQDQQSLNFNPYFMSNTDLHVSNILLNGEGTFNAEVPYDIEGEPRQDPPDIGADEFDPAIANDAGIFMAIGPVIPFASGVQPIDVALKNYGGDTLTEVNIRWLVNGIEQPSYVWTGNLAPSHCDTVTVGTYNFPEYTAHDLMYWTESPNNIPDSSTVNDTLYQTDLYPALAGTYTVGGILPDFNLFSQVQNALGFGGILGDVIFTIRNGTYAAQLLIEDFPRTSASHTVTFTSEEGDSSLVSLIRNFIASDANNYTVRLKDAHGIRFEHITLSSTKGLVIEMTDGSRNIEITHCQISGVNSPGSLGNYQLIYSGTTTEDSLLISNNRFEYGDQGIYMNASSGDLEQHVRILDNTFYNCKDQAIYCRYSSGVEIRNNRVLNTISRASGIHVLHAYDSPVISGNDIRLQAGGINGMYTYWVYGTSATPASVHNNYIYVTNSGSNNAVGIREDHCDHVVYRYNTVRIENAGTGSVAFYDEGSYEHIHIRNCIFANYTGGMSVQVPWSANSPINSINYTNLYSNGPVLAYYFNNYADLASLQMATQQNLLGMSAEPLFSSEGPDVFQAALDGTALPISGISTDIYGDARMVTTPDVGAREFTLPAHDIGAKKLVSPETYCGLSNTEEVTIRIQNYGANPETAFDVAYKFGVNPWVIENVGALVVQPGGTADYTFSTTLDLSQVSTYTFSLSSDMTTDLIAANDTLWNTEVIHIPALESPVSNMIPAHNAVNRDKPLSLSWSPAPNATRYDVYIWKTSDPEPGTPQIADLAQINKNYSSLEYGQAYNWKVVAKNSCNQMVSSAIQAFTMRNLPDLHVDTVIAPSTAYTGQPIEIEWVVRNQGTGSTQNTLWSDAVYLSSDATLNTSLDIYLGSVQNLTGLDNGVAYTHEATFTIPNYAVGNYYVFVSSDRFSSVIETNNNNNWSRAAVLCMVDLAPLPDLEMVIVSPPELAFSGQQITVLYTVENSGTAATGLKTWHDRLIFGTDPFNPTGFVLGTFPHTANLQPDSSYTISRQVHLPNNVFGVFYVFVQTDFHNVVYEFAAESNNVMRSDTIDVVLTPPADLVITEINIPDTISSGYPNPFSWTVSNMGAGPSLSGKWKDQIYISPAPVYNQNFNIPLSSRYKTQNVLSQDQYSLTATTLSMSIPAGYYYIYGHTDVTNVENEFTMEGNNIYAHPEVVYIANADLEVSLTSQPDTVEGTSAFSVSWDQLNNGIGRYVSKNVKTKLYGSNSPVFDPETAVLLLDEIKRDQSMLGLDTLEKSASISSPPYLFGDVYLHFHINDNGAVYEASGDTNNIYSSPVPIYIIGPPVPDIEVVEFLVPDTVTAGITWTLQYSVLNDGNLSTTVPWEDDIFISFDSVWTPAHSTKLIDISQNVMVAPADTAHTSVLLTLLPATTENVYYIYVKTDEEDNIYEGPGEANNISRSGAFYVNGAPYIDLEIDTIILEDAVLMSGQAYDLSWTTSIQNAGTPVINRWKDFAYLSTDLILDTLVDTRVGLFSPATTPSTFGPFTPYGQSALITIPASVSGSYYLMVESDFTKLHYDSIRQNNIELLRDEQDDPRLLTIELSPSPDLFISTLIAPSEVVVGQPFEIQFCTENIGNGVATGAWQNQVYLSTDLQINVGDIQLTTFNAAPSNELISIYPDSTACYPLNVLIPVQYTGNYYLIARTDPTNKIYEHNGENNNITIREIETTQPLPSDLVINNVTMPMEAIAGDVIEISWATQNLGSNPAYGVYREMVYLSTDSLWSADDPVFGIKDTSGYIPPLTTVASTVSGLVKDVVEGLYYAVVQTDVRQQIIESNDNNNSGASIDRLEVEVKTLIIDVPTPDTLYLDQELYYKIDILPGMEGESMVISLEGDSVSGFNELYAKFGTMPSRGDFEFGPQQANGPFQHIIIPELQVGTYYIAGYGSIQNGEPQEIELLATVLPYEILSSTPHRGVKDKKVTVEIRGIKLDQTERFRLRRSQPWFSLEAERVYVHNDNLVYATFDLTGVPLDTYKLDGVKTNNDLAISPSDFIVIESGEPELQLSALSPGVFWRWENSVAKIVVTFINTGDVDVENAVVEIKFPTGNLMAPTLAMLKAGLGTPVLDILLEEPNGPPGIIRPGGSGSVEVFVWAVQGPSYILGLK